MKNDDFGERMKEYERAYTSPFWTFIPTTQILCVRIDGKRFSRYTRKFDKPFDERLTNAFKLTTKFMVNETNAKLGYTQSDEITLIYVPTEKQSEYIFGGKTSKINSVFASMVTAFFNREMCDMGFRDDLAYFDCRAWGVPNIEEASNVVLWRAQDARKNSVSATFRSIAGHKKMQGLSGQQMKQYLLDVYDFDWETMLEDKYKYGTLIVPRERHIETDSRYFGDFSFEDRVAFLKNT